VATRDIVVVGASAGGVEALSELVKNLPKNFAGSVFIVMHIGSASALPHILDRCTELPVRHAHDDEKYEPGRIYVAPPDRHMRIEDGVVRVAKGPRENGHRPAIDVLFRTAARAMRDRVIGVLLSGGRDDGSAGLFAIKSRDGITVVQDPAEASVPDMPRNALEYVEVDHCLPVKRIASLLVDMSKRTNGIAEASSSNGKKNSRGDKVNRKIVRQPEAEFVPLACPECNGPLYEVREGEMAKFNCKVGHSFTPEGLSVAHSEALERALWTAIRAMNERITMHRKLMERPKRNKSEIALLKRLEEAVATAEQDVELLREIAERLYAMEGWSNQVKPRCSHRARRAQVCHPERQRGTSPIAIDHTSQIRISSPRL